MSDFDAKLVQARAKLPLRQVIEQSGKGPKNNNWRRFLECPFCGEKDCAGVFTPKSGNAPELFKCQHIPCPSGNQALDEIGFIALDRGLSRDEAWRVYFKEAGVWREERLAPSVMPGASRRRSDMEKSKAESEDSTLLAECESFIRQEGRASISLLQRHFKLGYSRAARVMDALEKRGVVGPARGSEPREILDLPDAKPVADALSAPGLDTPTQESVENAGASGVPNDTQRVAECGSGSAEPDSATSPLSENSLAEDESQGKDKSPSAPAAPPVGSSPVPEPPSPALAALRYFYERLTLVDSDRKQLWEKRGLHDLTVAAMGYRSNLKSNFEILKRMEEVFPVLVLVDSGLWTQADKPGEPPKPNPQYYGMSLVEKRDAKGKKVRDKNEDPIVECIWGDPGAILIPYFDTAGELVHLRPHKGMMRGRVPRLYTVRPSAAFKRDITDWKPGPVGVSALPGITMVKTLFADIEEWLEDLTALTAIITEGEFKAAALWQVLNDAVHVLEYPVVRQVVIGYDNEDKSNPALASYQEDKWRRFDAEAWARVLARFIAREGYEARVAHLPDAWRDAKGKADWDGRLATRLRELAVGDFAGYCKHAALLRAEFESVIKFALPVREMWQAQLFDTEEERIIKNKVEKILYERQLPVGGEDEVNIGRRLQRLIPRLRRGKALTQVELGYLAMLAKQYHAVDGGYYVFKGLKEKTMEGWLLNAEQAGRSGDADLKRACEIVLKGVPNRITDFHLKAHYCLVGTDNLRYRLVSIHNIHGVATKVVPLPSDAFAQPSKFREWLLNNITGAQWRAGERELQALHGDIGRDLAFKEVNEVAVRGHHSDSKCWFFGDVLYLPDGTEISRGQDSAAGKWDKDDIIWVKNEGRLTNAYKLSETDHEDQKFCHEFPKMHPEVEIAPEALKEFFYETACAFHDTLGSYTGFLVLGTMFSCFANPEIYRKFQAQSGLWLHGETQQGKSCVARWALRILGFDVDRGMPLKDSTRVGLSIALQQYGDLCIWLEEFQPGEENKWIMEKLKNVHGRESGIKKTFEDSQRREIRSMAMVTGVATCSDAQVKNRYVHVLVAEKNRKRALFDWFQENSRRFYLFGRHILRNRKTFADRTLQIMQEWMDDNKIVGVDSRARIVYGAAYAAFKSFNEILGNVFGDSAMEDFWNCAVAAGVQSVAEARQQVNVNQFWQLVLDALGSDAFGETPADRRRVFKVLEDPAPRLKLSEEQLRHAEDYGAPFIWKHYKLYFRPSLLLDKLQQHLRRQGRSVPLDKADLMQQMQTRDYWVRPSNPARGHSQRFEGDDGARYCWCVHLDHHELGYQGVTDEEYQASLWSPTRPDLRLASQDWADPRKGDLFAVVESLKSRRDNATDSADA